MGDDMDTKKSKAGLAFSKAYASNEDLEGGTEEKTGCVFWTTLQSFRPRNVVPEIVELSEQ